MNIRDFDVYDESSKKLFFDTFVYKVFVYSDEKISVLLTMKDGESTQEKSGSHKSLMAEKEGFEPSHPVTSLLAFQASPFSHLGISPTQVIITKLFNNVIMFLQL